jgi:hypothetical protein
VLDFRQLKKILGLISKLLELKNLLRMKRGVQARNKKKFPSSQLIFDVKNLTLSSNRKTG